MAQSRLLSKVCSHRGALLTALVLFPATAFAQEEEEPAKNHVSLFAGVTVEPREETKAAFTLGAAYERRLNLMWGVGALVDLAFGPTERTALVGVPIIVHIEPFELHAAPAVEFSQERDSEGESEGESKAKFAFRLGGGYEFELARFSIAPEANIDFVNGENPSLVVGLVFGWGF